MSEEEGLLVPGAVGETEREEVRVGGLEAVGISGEALEEAESSRPVPEMEGEEVEDFDPAPEVDALSTALPLRDAEGLFDTVDGVDMDCEGEAVLFDVAVKILLGVTVPEAVLARPVSDGEAETVTTEAVAETDGDPQEEGLRDDCPVAVSTVEAERAAVTVAMLSVGVAVLDIDTVEHPEAAADGEKLAVTERTPEVVMDPVGQEEEDTLMVPEMEGCVLAEAAPDAELVTLSEEVTEGERVGESDAVPLLAPVKELDCVRDPIEVSETEADAPLVRVAFNTRVEETLGLGLMGPVTLGDPDNEEDTVEDLDPEDDAQGDAFAVKEVLRVPLMEEVYVTEELVEPVAAPEVDWDKEELTHAVEEIVCVRTDVPVSSDVPELDRVGGEEGLIKEVVDWDKLVLTVPLRDAVEDGLKTDEPDAAGVVVTKPVAVMAPVALLMAVKETGSVAGAEGEILLDLQPEVVAVTQEEGEAQEEGVARVEPVREAEAQALREAAPLPVATEREGERVGAPVPDI